MGGFGRAFSDLLFNNNISNIASVFNNSTLESVVAYQFENLMSADDGATIMEAMI